MTKATILAHIKAANTNKDIKWYVAEKTDNKIVLTNSYDTCVMFTIAFEDDCIIVTDEHMGHAVDYLYKGESRWDDYKNDDDGVMLAIKSAVRYFNNVY